jgi:hypothetical protein
MARKIGTAEEPSGGRDYKERYVGSELREESVSVAFEEISARDWTEKV